MFSCAFCCTALTGICNLLLPFMIRDHERIRLSRISCCNAVTLNSFSDGKYDGNFIDHRFPRLLPVISEFETKLLPLTKALKKRYFANIDLENEEEFRPRYVEVSPLRKSRRSRRSSRKNAKRRVLIMNMIVDIKSMKKAI